MGVSKNNGTSKSSILIGFSIINHPFWGTPIFGNIHIPYLRYFSRWYFLFPMWDMWSYPFEGNGWTLKVISFGKRNFLWTKSMDLWCPYYFFRRMWCYVGMLSVIYRPYEKTFTSKFYKRKFRIPMLPYEIMKYSPFSMTEIHLSSIRGPPFSAPAMLVYQKVSPTI